MVKIKQLQNGVVIGLDDGEGYYEKAFITDGDQANLEQDAKERLLALYHLIDILGWAGSRYDAHRIRVVVEPGDKYQDLQYETDEIDDSEAPNE